MPPSNVRFTREDDKCIIFFLAENCPSPKSRSNCKIWQPLVNNSDWGQRHSLESWLNRYESNVEYFDCQITKYWSTGRRSFSPIIPVSPPGQFCDKDDEQLVEFLTQYLHNQKDGNISSLKRSDIYTNILFAHSEKYHWAKAHSAKAWQRRYITHMNAFNKRIEDARQRLGHIQQNKRDSGNLKYEESDMVGHGKQEGEQQGEGEKLDSHTFVGEELKRHVPEDTDVLSINHTPPSKRRRLINRDVPFPSSPIPASSNLYSGRGIGDEMGDGSVEIAGIRSATPEGSQHPVIEETRGEENISLPPTGDLSRSPSAFSEKSVSEALESPEQTDEHKDKNMSKIATTKYHSLLPSSTALLPEQFSQPAVSHADVVPDPIECSRSDPMHGSSPLPSSLSSQSHHKPPAFNAHGRVHASYAYAPLHFVKQTQMKSPSSDSDPFATSPARSEQPANVTHGPPRPRSDTSFRDSGRVRDRVYLLDQKIQYAPRHKQRNTELTSGQSLHALHPQEEKRIGHEASSIDAAKISSTNIFSPTSSSTTMAENAQAAQSSIGNDVRRRSNELSGGKEVFTSPTKAVGVFDVRDVEDTAQTTDSSDVFKSNTPKVLRDGHEQYPFKGFYFPGLNTASSDQYHTQSSSPVPKRGAHRNKLRRRTFNGLKSRSSLPNIDLVAKLNERASTHAPAFSWTKRSTYDPVKNKSFALHSSTRSLSEKRLKVARRASSASTIILPSDFEDDDLPESLNAMSPSSHSLVFRTGIYTILKQLENNHGFSAEVVRRAWISQNMDLHATDKMLLRMRIAAEKASLEEDENVFPGGTRTDKTPKGTHAGSSRQDIPALAPASDVESDYTPPSRSKAEEYLRLSAQDRVLDVTHQKRRTSGASESRTSSGRRSDRGNQFSGAVERISGQSNATAKLLNAATTASRITHFPRPKHSPSKAIPVSHPKLQPIETRHHRASMKGGSALNVVRSTEPIWSDRDDDVLRSGDAAKLEDLVAKFGDDYVRRRFLHILRE